MFWLMRAAMLTSLLAAGAAGFMSQGGNHEMPRV